MRVFFVLAALSFASLPSFAAFRAGTAKVDITPSGSVPLWGFEDRLKPATGTLDPLMARALVLEAGDKRLALVTLDLGRCFGPSAVDQPAWERTALEKLECAIQEATNSLAEARIGTGTGETYIGHNRLRVNAI